MKLFARSRFGTRRKPGEMNKIERAWADNLELDKRAGNILWYEFEPVKLVVGPDMTLKPDFMVMDKDGVVRFDEIKDTWKVGGKRKAHVEEDAWQKLKLAADKFWMFKFRIVAHLPGNQWEIKELGEKE